MIHRRCGPAAPAVLDDSGINLQAFQVAVAAEHPALRWKLRIRLALGSDRVSVSASWISNNVHSASAAGAAGAAARHRAPTSAARQVDGDEVDAGARQHPHAGPSASFMDFGRTTTAAGRAAHRSGSEIQGSRRPGMST